MTKYQAAEQREASRLDPDPLTHFEEGLYVTTHTAKGYPVRWRMVVPGTMARRWQPILAALVSGFVAGFLLASLIAGETV